MSSYNSDHDDDVSEWDLPYIEEQKNKSDEPTNAFNIKPGWKYEPPEKEEEILPPTAEDIEAIRAAAYEEGFNQGKEKGVAEGNKEGFESGHTEGVSKGTEEGRTAGLEEGKKDAQEIADTFEALVQQLHNPLEQVNDAVKKQVTQLAVTLARAVIQVEVQTNENVLAMALEKGLEALPLNEMGIQIHIHPDDIANLDTLVPKEKQNEKGWNIIEKQSLERGGVEVVSNNNAVDVSIERRTRDVIDKFLLSHGINDDHA